MDKETTVNAQIYFIHGGTHTMCMSFKRIMLNERSQSQTATCYKFHLKAILEKGIGTDNISVVGRG